MSVVGLAPTVVTGTRINTPGSPRLYGVYVGIVEDNQDPDGQGRVRVRFPWLDSGNDAFSTWARLATTMAGPDRGTWFVPEIDDEVLVAFQSGSPDHPFVIGSLWNGQDAPPVSMDSANNVKAIVSRQDIRIALDDTDGAVTLTLSTPGGQKVTLADSGSTLKLEDSSGNYVELAPGGITLSSSAKVTITATSVEVSAATVKVDAPMSTFTGVVKSDTNITTTTVSSSYTPGAGNIW